MNKSNRVMLVVAWLAVGVPLGWGVCKSVEKSLPLFGVRVAAPAPAAQAAGSPGK